MQKKFFTLALIGLFLSFTAQAQDAEEQLDGAKIEFEESSKNFGDIIQGDVVEHTFKFVNKGRRGAHELAIALLDGKLSYPSFVYLNEKFERVTISPGYKEAPQMLMELVFISEKKYLKMDWEKFKKEYEERMKKKPNKKT